MDRVRWMKKKRKGESERGGGKRNRRMRRKSTRKRVRVSDVYGARSCHCRTALDSHEGRQGRARLSLHSLLSLSVSVSLALFHLFC